MFFDLNVNGACCLHGTDRDADPGVVALTNIPPGKTIVHLLLQGYHAGDIDFVVKASETTRGSFTFKRDPHATPIPALPTLRVTDEADGTILTVEQAIATRDGGLVTVSAMLVWSDFPSGEALLCSQTWASQPPACATQMLRLLDYPSTSIPQGWVIGNTASGVLTVTGRLEKP